MAKIASKVIWWSRVNDAASYNIRMIPNGTPFSYELPPVRQVAANEAAEMELNLAGLQLAEGVYDIFITAVDAGANESDPFELADAVLDFTPPARPSAGGFR